MAVGRGLDIGNGGQTSNVYLVAVGIVLFYETSLCAWGCLVVSMALEDRPMSVEGLGMILLWSSF